MSAAEKQALAMYGPCGTCGGARTLKATRHYNGEDFYDLAEMVCVTDSSHDASARLAT